LPSEISSASYGEEVNFNVDIFKDFPKKNEKKMIEKRQSVEDKQL
jgi:hypothetical protein